MSCNIRARIKVVGEVLESRRLGSDRTDLSEIGRDRPKPRSVASFLSSGIQRCQGRRVLWQGKVGCGGRSSSSVHKFCKMHADGPFQLSLPLLQRVGRSASNFSGPGGEYPRSCSLGHPSLPRARCLPNFPCVCSPELMLTLTHRMSVRPDSLFSNSDLSCSSRSGD